MGERKIDIDTTKAGSASDTIVVETETRAQRKARMAQVLDRGIVSDRLNVDLSEQGLHPEWVHKDDVVKKRALGFKIVDKELLPGRSLHDTGDSHITVGDVVLMACDLETKEIIDEIRKEKYDKIHAPKGGKQKEEREFESQVDKTSSPIVESTVRTAKKQDITDAINAANSQKG